MGNVIYIPFARHERKQVHQSNKGRVHSEKVPCLQGSKGLTKGPAMNKRAYTSTTAAKAKPLLLLLNGVQAVPAPIW